MEAQTRRDAWEQWQRSQDHLGRFISSKPFLSNDGCFFGMLILDEGPKKSNEFFKNKIKPFPSNLGGRSFKQKHAWFLKVLLMFQWFQPRSHYVENPDMIGHICKLWVSDITSIPLSYHRQFAWGQTWTSWGVKAIFTWQILNPKRWRFDNFWWVTFLKSLNSIQLLRRLLEYKGLLEMYQGQQMSSKCWQNQFWGAWPSKTRFFGDHAEPCSNRFVPC